MANENFGNFGLNNSPAPTDMVVGYKPGSPSVEQRTPVSALALTGTPNTFTALQTFSADIATGNIEVNNSLNIVGTNYPNLAVFDDAHGQFAFGDLSGANNGVALNLNDQTNRTVLNCNDIEFQPAVGVVLSLILTGLPTSSAGLVAGQIWNNSGVLSTNSLSGSTGTGALVFANGPTLIAPVLGTPASGNLANCTFPTLNQSTTGSAAKWTTARNLAGNAVDGSANVAFSNAFVVQGTADTGLSGAQFLGALATGIVKNTTTTGVLSIAVAGDFPTLNQNTTGSAAKWTTARNLAGNSVDGSANVAFSNAFVVQGTADAGLSGAQFLGALGTGIVKNTTTTGVLSIASSSGATPDYLAPGSSPTLTGTWLFNAAVPIQLASTSTSGLQIYNTSDQVTNFERLELLFISNSATIRTLIGGTGTTRNLALQSGSAGAFLTLRPGGSTIGQLSFGAAAASTANNIGIMLAGNTQTQASGTFTGISYTATVNQTSTVANTYFKMAVTETAPGSGAQKFLDFYAGSSGATNIFSMDNKGNISVAGAAQPVLTTLTTVTTGAGSSAGTLANAPAVGNPTKWIPFNDAGTTRYFPAW